MNKTIQSLFAAGGTVLTGALLYVLRSRPVTPTHRSPAREGSPPQPQQKPKPKLDKPTAPAQLTAKALQEALIMVKPLIQRHPSFPIMECVLLENGQLTATDLEGRITIHVPALHLPSVCVNAAQLQKAVKGLKGTLKLRVENDRIILNDAIRLSTSPSSDFPTALVGPTGWDASPVFTLPLRFGAVLVAASRDLSRPNLSGVCLDFDEGQVVASDGHRLHLVSGDTVAAQGKLIVPPIAAKILSGLAPHGVTGQVLRRVEKQEHHDGPSTVLYFHVPGVELWTRSIDAEFPDYTQVVPKERDAKHVVTFETVPLLDAVQHALSLAPKDRLGIDLTCTRDGVRVRLAHGPESQLRVTVPAQGWTVKRYFGVNAGYLRDLLQCVSGKTTTFYINSEAHPILLRDGAFSAVVMPMTVCDLTAEMESEPTAVPIEVGQSAHAA